MPRWFFIMTMVMMPVVSARSGFVSVIPSVRGEPERHEFVFARLAYTNCRSYVMPRRDNWDVDYPKADRQLLEGLRRLTLLDAYGFEQVVRLERKELHRYPFVYIVEPGFMCMNEAQAAELRDYLMRGGFIFTDDHWGSDEWTTFVHQFRRVLPAARLKQVPLDHPVFHQVYDIREIIQVPSFGRGVNGGPTYEKDGVTPEVWGFFDERQRLMVLIMLNTDLGDAWEWAENRQYALRYGTYAYRMTINVIAYAMSH